MQPAEQPKAAQVGDDIQRAIDNLSHCRDVFDGHGRYSERDGVSDAIATLQRLRTPPQTRQSVVTFDPVLLSMLRSAADSCSPTLRGAVLCAYEFIAQGGRT